MVEGDRARTTSTPTVLCVEDDLDNQQLMRRLLGRRPGLRILITGMGGEAAELAVSEQPALILLDNRLPDMTGDDVLQILRAREATAEIPVVVVSGDAATQRPGDAALGVIGYLTKPFDIHELLSYVDEACGTET